MAFFEFRERLEKSRGNLRKFARNCTSDELRSIMGDGILRNHIFGEFIGSHTDLTNIILDEFVLRNTTIGVGTRVEKTSGYKWPGVVVAVFTTLSGETRYVVECTVPEISGALHIYNKQQLKAVGE